MKSMTYGTLPSKAAFHAHWTEAFGSGGTYNYVLRGSDAQTARKAKVPAEGHFTEGRLYGVLKKLRSAFFRGDENAGSIASSILSTLGFEWV